MNLAQPFIPHEHIEPKFSGLGSGRIAISACIALLALISGCAELANDRREAFLETRAEVLAATEPTPVLQASGWPWLDTGDRLARMAEGGDAVSDLSSAANAPELP